MKNIYNAYNFVVDWRMDIENHFLTEQIQNETLRWNKNNNSNEFYFYLL